MQKPELGKIWKDISDSAKEFAGLGLEAGSRALDYTAKQLKVLEAELKKNAEKLAPKAEKADGDGAPGDKQ